MGKGVEGMLSMIATKPTVSNTTKWKGHNYKKTTFYTCVCVSLHSHIYTSSLHNGIIMADSTSTCHMIDFFKSCPALCEDIHG